MLEATYIYGLYDGAGQLRYVGKANDPAARLKSHLRDMLRRNTPLYAWMRKHGAPQLRVLEKVEGDWREAERRHIGAARAANAPLLNVADGGDQPSSTPEQRTHGGNRLNAQLKADPRLARVRELKARIGFALRNGGISDSTKAKLRLAAHKAHHLFGSWANLT